MSRLEHRRIAASLVVAAVALATLAVACADQTTIGSQSDLDSIVASAGTPLPVGTIELGGSTIDLGGGGGSPGVSTGGGASGGAASGGATSGNGSSGGAGSSPGGGRAGAGGSGSGGVNGDDSSGDDSPPRDPSGSVVTTTVPPPVVVDTSPDQPNSAFCLTLAEALNHLAGGDLKAGAQRLLDDGALIDRLKLQAPSDGSGPVAQLMQAVQNLANGVPDDSPLVTVPLSQFAQWAGHTCQLVR